MAGMRQTSIEAYESLNATQTQKLRERIYHLLRINPMTDEELLEALGGEQYYSPSGVRARRSELVKDERFSDMRVYDSGLRRKTRFGKNTIVWSTTPQGSLL
jgi:hypothetical protein